MSVSNLTGQADFMADDSSDAAQVVNMAMDEEASGFSIFWAIVAIVTHAMLQVSFTGYIWNGSTFQGSMWPHRSSPFICLIDGVADGHLCINAFRGRQPNDHESEPHAGRNGALTRLALFALGVLPQAIKLFGMRGIPLTQVIAVMYLVPSILGMIRSFVSKSPQQEMDDLVEKFTNAEWSSNLTKGILVFCGWGPHGIGVFILWYRFADRVGFSATGNTANLADWIFLAVSFGGAFYMLQNMVFILFNKRSPIRGYPLPAILMFTNGLSINDLFDIPGRRLERGIIGRGQLTQQFLLSVCIVCYIIAALLYYLVDWAYNRCKHCWRCFWSFRHCHCQQDDSAEPQVTGVEDSTEGIEMDVPSQRLTTATSTPTSSDSSTQTDTAAGKSSTADRTEPEHAPDNTAPPLVTNGRKSKKPRDKSPIWLRRIWNLGERLLHASVGSIIILVLTWDKDGPPADGQSDDDNAAEQQQQAAEEGTFGSATNDGNQDATVQREATDPSIATRDFLHSGLHMLSTMAFWILKWVLIITWRLWIGCAANFYPAFNWLLWQTTENHPVKILVNAFGLVNFATAVVYYLVFFDSSGTSSPVWSEMFG